MSGARILVLALAAVAAVLVALYVRNASSGPAAVVAAPAQPAPVIQLPTTRVLIAQTGLNAGQRVTPESLSWQAWPEEAVSQSFLTEVLYPTAMEDYAGAVARVDIAAGEPITGRKLVNPGEAGYMAAILTPGMRAVSVSVNPESGAAGFILPGDRVDVILTQESGLLRGGRDSLVSQTILENVRVLAIDQTPRAAEEDQAIVGSTATLELIRDDAEMLILAEAMGDLNLVLRSVVDVHPDADLVAQATTRAPEGVDLGRGPGDRRTIVRFGVQETINVGSAP